MARFSPYQTLQKRQRVREGQVPWSFYGVRAAQSPALGFPNATGVTAQGPITTLSHPPLPSMPLHDEVTVSTSLFSALPVERSHCSLLRFLASLLTFAVQQLGRGHHHIRKQPGAFQPAHSKMLTNTSVEQC